MKRGTTWIAVSCLMVVALVLSSCTAATTESTPAQTVTGTITQQATTSTTSTTATGTTSQTTTTAVAPGRETMQNVWGETVEKPLYGGTINLAHTFEPSNADPYYSWHGNYVSGMVVESLGRPNWASPRDEIDFTSFVPPQYTTGNLAESFEMPDPLTLVYHIRKGIRWQDKAPMNGREFTADDVKFNLDRAFGTGNGFTEPTAYDKRISGMPVVSVTVTDKYTVELKLSSFSFAVPDFLWSDSWTAALMLPPEVIRENGDMKDWTTVVGTGPYVLTDWVHGSSLLYEANPNYWRTDERHPGMRLPYADEIRMLIITDVATRTAALRTGKLDVLGGFNTEQADLIRASNPELLVASYKFPSLLAPSMNINKEPFGDINVRMAMQMAIDREEIAEDYYMGAADPGPYGIAGPAVVGYFTPFDEWPEDIKEGYRYDPEGAKQLLSDAGYPNGFTTSMDVATSLDADLYQILKAYWAEIGVTVELNMMENSAYMNRVFSGAHEMTARGMRGTNSTVFNRLQQHATGEQSNWEHSSDPVYDDLFARIYSTSDRDEFMSLVKEASMYINGKYYQISIPRPYTFGFAQPWLKGGWWGQGSGGAMINSQYANFWIDEDLKRESGH